MCIWVMKYDIKTFRMCICGMKYDIKISRMCICVMKYDIKISRMCICVMRYDIKISRMNETTYHTLTSELSSAMQEFFYYLQVVYKILSCTED